MRCFRFQGFGQTLEWCASSLVCGVCGENVYCQAACPNPPHCVHCSGSHAFGDKLCPGCLTETSIQELWAKEGLSFLEARKTFLDSRPKIGNQSCASAHRISRGIDAASQTTATPVPSNSVLIRTASRATASTETEVATQTEDHSDPVVPGIKMHSYWSRAQGMETQTLDPNISRNSRHNPSQTKHVQFPGSFRQTDNVI
jgi:hypothetical protein